MKTYSIKFPSGLVGEELLHFMGADDERNLQERPAIAQRLAKKCFCGKVAELDQEELQQLYKEVDNAADIKADHVGDGEWSGLHQYRLTQFGKKVKGMLYEQ